MILETKKVSKLFGQLAALVEVDLSVEEGEMFGIAGPNGAGKSTLFNSIAGVYPVSSGRVIFDGHDITALKSHQICRRGLGRTFQTPKTFPTLTVSENLRVGTIFGARQKGKRVEQKIEETLQFLGLDGFRDTLATKLDLYSTKLVMLGATLATDCRLLMLDEPMSGFSVSEIKDFLQLIAKINQERQITIIIIEHLLDTLIDVSERMMVLHNGEVIYVGEPHGVREDEKVVEVYLGKVEDDDAFEQPDSA